MGREMGRAGTDMTFPTDTVKTDRASVEFAANNLRNFDEWKEESDLLLALLAEREKAELSALEAYAELSQIVISATDVDPKYCTLVVHGEPVVVDYEFVLLRGDPKLRESFLAMLDQVHRCSEAYKKKYTETLHRAETAEAEREALRKDAERYLWLLRNSESNGRTWIFPAIHKQDMNDCRTVSDIIDTAISAEGG
jgi:hypothetical protein